MSDGPAVGPGLELCGCRGASSPSARPLPGATIYFSVQTTSRRRQQPSAETASTSRGSSLTLGKPSGQREREGQVFPQVPSHSSRDLPGEDLPSSPSLPAALQTSRPRCLLPALGARGPDRSPGCDIGLCKPMRIITVRFVKQSPFGGGSDYSLLL